MRWLKIPRVLTAATHRRALSFSAGVCEVGAGNNSQCNLCGTRYGHPYKAARARGVPETP